MRRLHEAIDKAMGGRGGAVLVVGEPGIGKTRLVKEAAARARERDVLVLAARAHAMETDLAYAPIVEAFGRCLSALAPSKRAALVSGLPDLARLFRGLPLSPPAIGDPALERTRLFSA